MRFLFLLAAAMILFFGLCLFGIRQYILPVPRDGMANAAVMDNNVYRIRKAFFADSRYRYYYSVGEVRFADNKFDVDINFHSTLRDDQLLRAVARDAARIFNRVSGKSPGEISLFRAGRVIAKISIPGRDSRAFISYYR
jgi:hypothetical protein